MKLSYEGSIYDVSIEEIDAFTAKRYFETIKLERKISASNLNRISYKLLNKHWINLNGDTILFDCNGNLIDGQHRLLAIIKTGIPIVTFVIRGIEASIFYGKDKGKNRSISDTLSMLDYSNTNVLAATLKLLWMYKNNSLKQIGLRLNVSGKVNREFDDRNAVNLLKEHKHLNISIANSLKLYRKQNIHLFTASMLSFYFYILPYIEPKDAITFLETIVGIKENINTPMQYLIKRAFSSYKTPLYRDKLSVIEFYAITNKCWNCFIQGRHINSIRGISWKYKEEFPNLQNEDGVEVHYADIDWNKNGK